jgi:predicted phage terminase large subunit-like protein
MDKKKVLEGDTVALPPMNKYREELIRQILRNKEIQDNIIRDRGKTMLYGFNKYVMEVEKNKQALGDFHWDLCDFVTDNKKRKKLILMPRGHLKSTLITIGYSVQQIIANPNVRILIMNATWQMAVDFLSEIKNHLQKNERLLELFGDVTEGAEEWAADRIKLKRTDFNIKGPTVQAAGIDSNLVGSHPDIIIFDDVHGRDNVATREQIEKVKLRYKDAVDLLEPGGQFIVIGTRWCEGDLYDWILDKDNQVSKSFDVMIKKAYTGDVETGVDFKSLWPEKFTQEELLKRLHEKGWYEFSAQYLNNPVPPEDADFKREWFQYYDREDYKGANHKNIMTIDPAISLEKEADFTAMTVGGIDSFSNIYIKDLVRKRMKPNEIINTIFSLYALWHPTLIALETVAYQKALSYALTDEMRRRGVSLPIYEISSQDRGKDQRIRGMQPTYMNKKVYHPKNHPLTPYLEEELLTFPRGKHDDMIDSESMLFDFLSPPRQKSTRFHQHYLY